MKNAKLFIAACIICISLLITGCGKPGAETASETVPGSPEESVSEAAVDYGQIKGDFSGMTLEMAKAYLAVVDDIAAHLGYNEKEAAPDEYLHGGFICDWDGDGTPDMCLLLKTSPRESGNWEGTPLYGWNAPTLRLYTFKDGQAVLAGESDLYFATAGREAAVSALKTDNGLQTVWFDRNDITEEGYAVCFELKDGAIQKKRCAGRDGSSRSECGDCRGLSGFARRRQYPDAAL